MKGLFFFESVGVPRGSPELGKGNPGWVPSVLDINPKTGFDIIHKYTI